MCIWAHVTHVCLGKLLLCDVYRNVDKLFMVIGLDMYMCGHVALVCLAYPIVEDHKRARRHFHIEVD